MSRGRKKGYTHLSETKRKISKANTGRTVTLEHRDRISKSLSAHVRTAEHSANISKALTGRTKTAEHKVHISKSLYDLDGKCRKRLLELRADYPEHEDFFDANESELLFAMRGLKSERELSDIRRYKETASLSELKEGQLSFEYATSSYNDAEDSMIALIDLKMFLQKMPESIKNII